MEILLVDDDRVIREALRKTLIGEGFDVRMARDGAEALEKFTEKRPDLVLLDVMMPKMNGFKVCEAIRRADALLPIIFLTARDSDIDQVRGIGLGGDDYLSKDAGEAVLLARVRRALARVGRLQQDEAVFSIGTAKVDLNQLTIFIGRREVPLTRTEGDILRLLSTERGRYISKDEMIASLRGVGYACEDGMVYTHIYNIRRKLGSAAAALTGDRSLGYRLIK